MTKKRAIEMLTNMRNNYDAYGKLTGKDEITQMLDMAIEALQEQKVGKWKKDIDFGGHTHYYCSLCNNEGWHTDKYCSECGAKMEGAEE